MMSSDTCETVALTAGTIDELLNELTIIQQCLKKVWHHPAVKINISIDVNINA